MKQKPLQKRKKKVIKGVLNLGWDEISIKTDKGEVVMLSSLMSSGNIGVINFEIIL